MLFDGMGVQHTVTWLGLGLGLVFKQVTLVWLWFVCDGVRAVERRGCSAVQLVKNACRRVGAQHGHQQRFLPAMIDILRNHDVAGIMTTALLLHNCR